jgi:hypothetical protein
VEFDTLKKQLLDSKGDAVAITAALRGAGRYGKTMLAKALAHDAPPQTTSLPLRHAWRKTNNCHCSVSANTLTRDGMPMDFLLSHFTLLGVDLQWWMPILAGVTAVYAFWLVRFGPGD